MHYVPLPRPPEHFQQPPSAAEIAALASRLLGPAVDLAEASEIGGGAFNNAFRITACDGRRWVMRVSPPHAHTLLFHVENHLLRREHSILPWLAAIGPWLPRVAGVDFTGEILPRDAVISDFIEGDNWHEVMSALSPAENESLWRQLAGLLRRVHATPAPHFGWTDPEEPCERWSEFVLGSIRGLLTDLSRLGVNDTAARAWFAVAERGSAALDGITTPYVLHGDPWPKNVLIRRASAAEGGPRIVALLDHERGLFGDPLSEWVFNGCDFPPVFWETYGARPTDAASRFRAAVYRGTIDIQCLLEGPRYQWGDAAAQDARLSAGAEEMRCLLAQL